ncbi:hypothetical protein GCT13_30165 [Paraburkholderia sp. CNPSo 3157]|uniref:Lipoprotein n=1 Tax=Paraburkholderia franconis TaxID=2654983 RepID=A0A7X1NGD9_9BURK|nr:hypothetical protein [Paraburkholderia franconis]MPW21023.1 hypothetical protein [Paraburkholderia franconis]
MNPLLLKRSGIACFALLTAACSLFVPRAPSSQVTPADNALVIAAAREFPYMPAREGHITPNRIANTATTAVLLKKGVESAVREAVVTAWRKSGITVTTHDRLVLSGGIEALSVDDARSPAIWTITVRYFVTNASTRETIYVRTTTVHMYRQKFTNPAFALDDIVKLSVDMLVRDPLFRDALQPVQ